MLSYTILSQGDDFISSLKYLQNKLSIKSKIIDQIILFFDLVVSFYPSIVNQWRNLERGQKALSSYEKHVSMRKKIRLLSENIPDFIIINLSKSDRMSKTMEMRGYGKRFPRTGYPYVPLKNFDYFFLLSITLFILGIHVFFKV
jgi:energy-coupling factor transporter transmembrane protein EcfT